MRWPITSLMTLVVVALGCTSAYAEQTIELTGTLRDFRMSHSDFEANASGYPLITGMVQDELGADGLPVLNAPEDDIPSIWRIGSTESFNQWYRDVAGVNTSVKHSITLRQRSNAPHIFRFEASKHNGRSFFPLDGRGFGNEGLSHNYHFTYHVHTKFTYTDPDDRDYDMEFSFSGDDDVWVFINRRLAVDIGGVHGERYDSVNLDDMAEHLGLVPGNTYDFHFFFAERHTTESNFTMETTIQFLSPLYD